MTTAEIIATIYEALGILDALDFRDAVDRPYVLVTWGKPSGGHGTR